MGHRSVDMEEALRTLAHLLAGPPIEAQPDMTPDLWRRMHCRTAVARGEHSRAEESEPWSHAVTAQALRGQCRCEVCCVELDNARAKYDWEVEQDLRPHRKHAHEFGSPRAALELLARYRRVGTSTRSSLGSAQARAEETARLGTAVQTTVRADRESLEVRRVHMAADVERACLRAFAEEQARRGVPAGLCVQVLLDSVTDGSSSEEWAERLGLTERAVKALVRHGMRQVTVELVCGGYIPEPRASAGLAEAIERRRAELERRVA